MLPNLSDEDSLLLRVQVALSVHLLQKAKSATEPLLSIVQSAVQSARSNLKLIDDDVVSVSLTAGLQSSDTEDDHCESFVDRQSLTAFNESQSFNDHTESGLPDSAVSSSSIDCDLGDLSNIELGKSENHSIESEKEKVKQLSADQVQLLNSVEEDLKSMFRQDYETLKNVVNMMMRKVPDLEDRLLAGLDDMLKDVIGQYRAEYSDYIDELLSN